jgi:hypothetical protein
MPYPYEKNKKFVLAWNAKNPEKKKLADAKTNKKKNDFRKIQRIFLKILRD